MRSSTWLHTKNDASETTAQNLFSHFFNSLFPVPVVVNLFPVAVNLFPVAVNLFPVAVN